MAIVRYTLLRLAVLAATLLLFWLLGVRGLLLPLLAIVVAALVSFLSLPRHADAAAGVLAERDARRQTARATVDEDAEDAALDVAEPDRPGTDRPGTDGPGTDRTSPDQPGTERS